MKHRQTDNRQSNFSAVDQHPVIDIQQHNVRPAYISVNVADFTQNEKSSGDANNGTPSKMEAQWRVGAIAQVEPVSIASFYCQLRKVFPENNLTTLVIQLLQELIPFSCCDE